MAPHSMSGALYVGGGANAFTRGCPLPLPINRINSTNIKSQSNKSETTHGPLTAVSSRAASRRRVVFVRQDFDDDDVFRATLSLFAA